jgi:hypothetical protein
MSRRVEFRISSGAPRDGPRVVAHWQLLEAIDAGGEIDSSLLECAVLDFDRSRSFPSPRRRAVLATAFSDVPIEKFDSPLTRAARVGNVAAVGQLVRLGATVDRLAGNVTALILACRAGHLGTIQALLDAGADPNACGPDGKYEFIRSPLGHAMDSLSMSSNRSKEQVVLCLLKAGANPHFGSFICKLADRGMAAALRWVLEQQLPQNYALLFGAATSMHWIRATKDVKQYAVFYKYFHGTYPPASVLQFSDAATVACTRGHLDCLRLLLPHCFVLEPPLGEWNQKIRKKLKTRANVFGFTEISDELEKTRNWSSPLHGVEFMAAGCARALLRDGSPLHYKSEEHMPTALEMAHAHPSSPASAVLRLAAGPWSPEMHSLLPAKQRRWVVAVLLLGHLLSRNFGHEAGSFADVWLSFVLPHAGRRDF